MSSIYDNWERLVDAVLKKEQLWQLFHAQSRSPSISSDSSSAFSFSLASDWSAASDHREDDNGAIKTPPSSILVKDQSPVENLAPNKNVTFTASTRKRDLRIQVPRPLIQHYGALSPKLASPVHFSRVHPRVGVGHCESHTKGPDDAKQQSHPLPLPPEAFSHSSPFSRSSSTATSPKVPSHSPERAENRKNPGTSWKRGKLLGKGTFGNVYLGFNSETGQMCAMKEFNLHADGANSKQSARLFGKEIALLSTLKHPNIVPYYGSETVDDNLYIYYEYVSGGSIYMILQEYGKLGESAIRSYTHQILSGLVYLHSRSITHRNIRAATILFDPTGGVKLSNFGIEKQIAGQSRPSLLMDSPYWMPPEAIMNPNARNKAIDIWSLGCTIIEMATSKPPFSQYDWAVAVIKIANHRELPSIPDHLSDDGKDFLRHCLQWNHMHRATASQLLEHPFVKSSSPLAKQNGVFRIPATSENIDHARIYHLLDSRELASRPSRAPNSKFQPSDMYTPRIISTPISPVGSPLPHPRSPLRLNTQISTPPKSNLRVSSSSGAPLIGRNDAIQYPHLNQSLLPPETFRNLPKHSPSANNSPSYWDPNILQGVLSGDSDSQRKQFGRVTNGQVNEQSALADRVFQQLFRANMMSHHVA